MHRFTISLDDDLAHAFDELIARRGYANRSEAVRDLIRQHLGEQMLSDERSAWCAATVSYVYDHHEQALTQRLLGLQHDHHDLVVSSQHTHLDHDHCLESVVLRGPTAAVRDCASALVALRGVRHGQIQLVPMAEHGHGHRHDDGSGKRHRHLTPVN